MISMDKQYKTRDGNDVRLLCVDGPGRKPVVGFVGNIHLIFRWSINGHYDSPDEDNYNDLVEVKKTALIQGVMFYYIDGDGELKVDAATSGRLQDYYRQFWKQRNIKFTETPFEVEVETPS